MQDDEIFVDASTSWGIGLTYRGRWLAWKYREGWSDNQGVIGVLAAGKSYNAQENAILQQILRLYHEHEIWFTITYIPSKENPADPMSRGEFLSKRQLIERTATMPINTTTRAAARRVLQDKAIQAQATQPVHGRRTSSRGTHSVLLTADVKAKIQYTLEHTWADSTIKKYGQSLEAYHRFCDKQEIPASFRLPTSEELLCAFAASRVCEVAGGTARSAVAAKGGLCLRYTLKGMEKLALTSSTREEQLPVTKDMINQLKKELDLSNPEDAVVFAAACCAFWGQI
ncbi:hypothetical protein DFH08DRAFT_933727 [Mycena albidolilacea]|uniref:Core-binding (CB) domain-containing protein n=1 Tax=Mycena albidolilacea TaxID=1033008 RepID=A0AAD7ADV0_9AGAR|nr:hypothetical protein DFH08DRAFT_933727 [Mycena albidolilacea]